MKTTTPDTSFVKNQPVFHLLCFDPASEQWKYSVVIGAQDFNYSGGLWAFADKAAVNARIPKASRLSEMAQKIESGRVVISKHGNYHACPEIREYVNLIGRYNKPDANSFFQSMLLDMDAGEISFADFCAEFGYNEDSIKDQQLHQLCSINARKFRSVVSKEEITHLREVLADF